MADLAQFPITRRWPAANPDVIQLYSFPTPNGVKVSIVLEELGLDYEPHKVTLSDADVKSPEFLSLNPNNKIPAIIDRDNDLALMETGAIMMYLADKTGKLLPREGEARYRVIEWLMWQMGGIGPILGQVHHFVKYNPGKAPYAEERYSKEAKRLYGVLDKRLEGRDYIVDDLSIADFACWPWISRYDWQQIDLNEFPNVKRWYINLAKRPSVQKGYDVPLKVQDIPIPE